MSTNEMNTVAREYREIQAMIKELEEQADSLKQTLIKEMDNRRVDTVQAGEFKVSYKLVESGRLDSKALKAAHSDIYSAFTKKTTSTRFTVA